MMKKILLIVLVGLSIWSCNKTENTGGNTFQCPISGDPFKATQCESDSIAKLIGTSDLAAVKHSSGMYYSIQNAGFGIAPTSVDRVKCRYVGTFLGTGVQFDANAVGAVFGLNQVITGWTVGIPLIKKGGRITLYIPPSMAYGSAGSRGVIPPYAYLKFVVDLDDVL